MSERGFAEFLRIFLPTLALPLQSYTARHSPHSVSRMEVIPAVIQSTATVQEMERGNFRIYFS